METRLSSGARETRKARLAAIEVQVCGWIGYGDRSRRSGGRDRTNRSWPCIEARGGGVIGTGARRFIGSETIHADGKNDA